MDRSLAAYYFHQGTNYKSYDYMGCHISKIGNEFYHTFRVWAQRAEEVVLIGDFCNWTDGIKMARITEKGIFEAVIKSKTSLEGSSYKYLIKNGTRSVYKADPYANYSKGGKDGASIIYRSRYKWNDIEWLKRRKKTNHKTEPLNIYELHLGSFIRKNNGEFYSYRELAEYIVPYIKYMGYTHVEFLPIAEHPFYDSWGYQICSFFAPSARYGSPDDLKFLIDKLHENGIGVILDWVCAHFPKDEWGLFEFDGAYAYEYQGSDRIESRSWKTRMFDLGREEVQSFLISSAIYFINEFHIDGLRVDAVASILYLDYDKNDGEWIPNVHGENINLEGVAFLKKLNTAVINEKKNVLMIAEESGTFTNLTSPLEDGGLGFTMKWNMGFANDAFDYMKTDPIYRKYKHKALNFPLMYAYKENYVLPISHDEVVHGKLSLINKMHGGYEDKFWQMRAFMIYFMTFPGKKLTFMGTEFAQFREWDHLSELEWFMLGYDQHRYMRDFIRELNLFYTRRRELWELDFDPKGFEWIYADENDKNMIAYKRLASDGDEILIFTNFSGIEETVAYDSKNLICIFDSGRSPVLEENEIILKPFSACIFERKRIKLYNLTSNLK